VDLGVGLGFSVELMPRRRKSWAGTGGWTALILQGRGATAELDEQYARGAIEAQRKVGKPFIAIFAGRNVLEEKSRKALLEAGIPIFPSASEPSGPFPFGPSWRTVIPMEERKFKEELETIKLDIESFARPLSSLRIFHGREKLFGMTSSRRRLALLSGILQKRFDG